MTLGEHCDEIVRLIDETLGTLGAPRHSLSGAIPAAVSGSPGVLDTVPATSSGPDLGSLPSSAGRALA